MIFHDHTHVDVFDDGRVEPPVEGVGGVALPWSRLEQVLNPAPPEGKISSNMQIIEH